MTTSWIKLIKWKEKSVNYSSASNWEWGYWNKYVNFKVSSENYVSLPQLLKHLSLHLLWVFYNIMKFITEMILHLDANDYNIWENVLRFGKIESYKVSSHSSQHIWMSKRQNSIPIVDFWVHWIEKKYSFGRKNMSDTHGNLSKHKKIRVTNGRESTEIDREQNTTSVK